MPASRFLDPCGPSFPVLELLMRLHSGETVNLCVDSVEFVGFRVDRVVRRRKPDSFQFDGIPVCLEIGEPRIVFPKKSDSSIHRVRRPVPHQSKWCNARFLRLRRISQVRNTSHLIHYALPRLSLKDLAPILSPSYF